MKKIQPGNWKNVEQFKEWQAKLIRYLDLVRHDHSTIVSSWGISEDRLNRWVSSDEPDEQGPNYPERVGVNALCSSYLANRDKQNGEESNSREKVKSYRKKNWEGRELEDVADEEDMTKASVRAYAKTHDIVVVDPVSTKVEDRKKNWEGRDVKTIAEETGMSSQNIKVFAERHGINLLPGEDGRRGPRESRKGLEEERRKNWEGRSAEDIAKDENLTVIAVRSYAGRRGIELKNSGTGPGRPRIFKGSEGTQTEEGDASDSDSSESQADASTSSVDEVSVGSEETQEEQYEEQEDAGDFYYEEEEYDEGGDYDYSEEEYEEGEESEDSEAESQEVIY